MLGAGAVRSSNGRARGAFARDSHREAPRSPVPPLAPPGYRASMAYDPMHQAQRQMERAERQVTNKVSSFIWGLVLIPVFLCVFASIFGGVIFYVMRQKAEIDAGNVPGSTGGPGTAATWDGTTTFECGGNDAPILSGQTVTLTASPAIRTRANCRLTLENMNITAPVVIDAQGNSRVTVTGGSLNGAQNSIVASANASVDVGGATVTGPVQRSGNGHVNGVP